MDYKTERMLLTCAATLCPPAWVFHIMLKKLPIIPFSNATKCSLLSHLSLPIIPYYALKKSNCLLTLYNITIIFRCTEARVMLQYSLQSW